MKSKTQQHKFMSFLFGLALFHKHLIKMLFVEHIQSLLLWLSFDLIKNDEIKWNQHLSDV